MLVYQSVTARLARQLGWHKLVPGYQLSVPAATASGHD